MREPANKRMLTDVSGLRSYRCTIIKLANPSEFREGTENVASNLDKGHKRMRTATWPRSRYCGATTSISNEPDLGTGRPAGPGPAAVSITAVIR